MIETVGILSMIGALLAALFAFLAWEATREREPFRLSPKAEGIIVLTRTGWRPVTVHFVAITHNRELLSTDDRGDTQGRRLSRYDFVVLDVHDIPAGETMRVDWTCWPRKKMKHWGAPVLATPRQ